MQEENNKVIIIGNDHINTLGVIRTFGENGIKPYLMVVSDTKRVAVTKSKYVEKCWLCNDSVNIIELLKKEFKDEKNKPVIIPTTDYVAALLDIYYNELKEIFILPNINKKKGEINNYMDKYNQYLLFKKYNIGCAESIKIELNGQKLDDEIENKIIFPCIVKPLISAFGSKSDIEICDNIDSLNKVLLMLYNKEYKDVLVQELLDYDYECDIAGFVYDNKVSIPGIIKKIRIWPAKKGSTTYGEVMPVEEANLDINNIEKMLSEIGYNGVFDIDLFIKDSKIYINEVNFRNGALSYGFGDSYICYNWYLSCIREEFIKSVNVSKKYNMIDDQADLHNIADKVISYKEYMEDKETSKIKLVWNKIDYIPSKYMFFNKLINKVNISNKLKVFSKIIHRDKKHI